MEIQKGEPPIDYQEYLKLKRGEGEPTFLMRVQNDTIGSEIKPINLLRGKGGYTSSVEVFTIFFCIGFFYFVH